MTQVSFVRASGAMPLKNKLPVKPRLLDDLIPRFDVMRKCLPKKVEEEELPDFDKSQCNCSHTPMPPCGYCERGKYKST